MADPDRVNALADAMREAGRDLDLIGSTEILGGIVAAHGWAARALATDVLSIPANVTLEVTVSVLDQQLRSRQGNPAGDQLARALLRADTLAVYARLLAQTLAPTRAAAARRSRMPPHRIKTLLVMHVLLNLCVVAGCVGKSSDWGLKQELVTALAHTQLLEHAARALLHVAQATPAASSTAATGTATATGPTDEDWACVSQTAYILFNTVTYLTEDPNIVSLCPRPRENDTQYDATQTPEKVRLLEQLRPLLAGRCVQVVLAWAGLCAVVTAQQRAGGGGSGKEGAAPARSQLGYGLPPELMRPLQPLQQVETPNESSHMAAVAAEVCAPAFYAYACARDPHLRLS